MEKQARARAAIQLTEAEQRRLQRAWEHIYSIEGDTELTKKLINDYLKLDVLLADIKARYEV